MILVLAKRVGLVETETHIRCYIRLLDLHRTIPEADFQGIISDRSNPFLLLGEPGQVKSGCSSFWPDWLIVWVILLVGC